MRLTVDFAWDAEKPTTRESFPYIDLECEEKKTLVEVQEMSNILKITAFLQGSRFSLY